MSRGIVYSEMGIRVSFERLEKEYTSEEMEKVIQENSIVMEMYALQYEKPSERKVEMIAKAIGNCYARSRIAKIEAVRSEVESFTCECCGEKIEYQTFKYELPYVTLCSMCLFTLRGLMTNKVQIVSSQIKLT